MNPTSPLALFYKNSVEREAVQMFFVEQLRKMAANKAIDGESTVGIKEASDLVEEVFNELEALYGEKPEKKVQNSR
jgi:proline dehydrogenase